MARHSRFGRTTNCRRSRAGAFQPVECRSLRRALRFCGSPTRPTPVAGDAVIARAGYAAEREWLRARSFFRVQVLTEEATVRAPAAPPRMTNGETRESHIVPFSQRVLIASRVVSAVAL